MRTKAPFDSSWTVPPWPPVSSTTLPSDNGDDVEAPTTNSVIISTETTATPTTTAPIQSANCPSDDEPQIEWKVISLIFIALVFVVGAALTALWVTLPKSKIAASKFVLPRPSLKRKK